MVGIFSKIVNLVAPGHRHFKGEFLKNAVYCVQLLNKHFTLIFFTTVLKIIYNFRPPENTHPIKIVRFFYL